MHTNDILYDIKESSGAYRHVMSLRLTDDAEILFISDYTVSDKALSSYLAFRIKVTAYQSYEDQIST